MMHSFLSNRKATTIFFYYWRMYWCIVCISDWRLGQINSSESYLDICNCCRTARRRNAISIHSQRHVNHLFHLTGRQLFNARADNIPPPKSEIQCLWHKKIYWLHKLMWQVELHLVTRSSKTLSCSWMCVAFCWFFQINWFETVDWVLMVKDCS